jgi:uncharacterized protein
MKKNPTYFQQLLSAFTISILCIWAPLISAQDYTSNSDTEKQLLESTNVTDSVYISDTSDSFKLDNGYVAVFDNESPNFELVSGDWKVASEGDAHDYYYYTIDGPGEGKAKARWIADGLPKGEYLIEYWAAYGDYAEDACYFIISNSSDSGLVYVNMNYIESGWYKLGIYDLDQVCIVEITDEWSGAGTKLSVDALRFTLLSELPPPPKTAIRPYIGICIDDAGGRDPDDPERAVYNLLRLPYKVTIAVIPGREFSVKSAERIHELGSEVFLHQPMAAISIPDSGGNGINEDTPLENVKEILKTNLDSIPFVVGMNNHTGSLISQMPDKIKACCDVLYEKGLFFLDSRTITNSEIYRVADRERLFAGQRNIFIDARTVEQSKNIIRSLAMRALYAPNMTHIGIGHVRSTTAEALKQMAPELEKMGVDVKPVSYCMSQIIGKSLRQIHNEYFTMPLDALLDKLILDNDGSIETISFKPQITISGNYDLYGLFGMKMMSDLDLKVKIKHNKEIADLNINKPVEMLKWIYLGTFRFSPDSESLVQFKGADDRKFHSAEAVSAIKCIYAGPGKTN